jgi:hypothetical protein
MLKTNNLNIKIVYYIIFVFFLIPVFLHLTEYTTKADSGNVIRKPQGSLGDGCTFGGTLMNTVVFVEFVDGSDRHIGWASDFNTNVQSFNPANPIEHSSGIVKNIDTRGAEWVSNRTFSGNDNQLRNCDLRSINKGPNKATALNFTDQEHYVHEWKLSCGFAANGNKNRIFEFRGIDTPSGIPGGYQADGWANASGTVRGGVDANYLNIGVHLKYRVKPMQTATITLGSSVSREVVYTGENVTFTQTASTSNLANVGNDTFNYNVSGQNPTSGTKRLSPAGQKVNPDSSVTKSFSSPGMYCRGISIAANAKPGYAIVNGNGGQSCVNVVEATTSTKVDDYEKGSGNQDITHTINISPCVDINVRWTVSGTQDGVAYNTTRDTPLGPGNCSKTETYQNTEVYLNKLPAGFNSGSYNTTSPTHTSSDSFTVYEVPYTRFYGQDIYATGCYAGSVANLVNINGKAFFNTKASPPSTNSDGGAGQYATIAKSTINMATAAFRSTNPTPPSGLSVQNYTGPMSCSKGIHTSVTNQLPGPINSNWSGGSISGLPAGYYKANGNINMSGDISNSITVSSEGNVFIDDDIKGGSMNKVVTILADNIYVKSSVQQLDAILIAKGTVYTCAENSSSEVTRNNWATQCNHKLTINGAVSAKNIKFARSIGTRLMASDLTPDGNTITGSNGGISTAAEIINFPAYLNFAPLQLDDNSDDSYQAIFNVPPYL